MFRKGDNSASDSVHIPLRVTSLP